MALKKKAPVKRTAKKVVKKAAKKAAKPTAKPQMKKTAPKASKAKVAKKASSSNQKPAKKVAKKPIKATGKAKSGHQSMNSNSKLMAKPSAKAVAGQKNTASSFNPLGHLPPLKKSRLLDVSGFVTPLDDRILVQVSGSDRVTPGGLYIPDTIADVSGNLQGVVVAVGRGRMSKKGHIRPMDVRNGDLIVFSQYAGSKIEFQNEDLVILREADVMGVVSK